MPTTDFGDPHQIIHIPARDLTGTREAKLAELDMFLTQLRLVRLALCGETARLEGFDGAPREPRTDRGATARSWPARRLRTVLNAVTATARRTRDWRR